MKSGFGVEQRDRVLQHFAIALAIACKNLEGGRGVRILDRIVELVAQALEFRDVRRKQVAAAAIQRLEVAFEDLRGHGVVERGLPVVLPFDYL